MRNYVTEFLKYNRCETVTRSAVTHDVCSCHLTLYTVRYIAISHIKNCCSSDMRQLWTALTVLDTRKCPHYSLVLGNIRALRTSDKTREFHFKSILTQGVSVYVNIRATLNVVLTNKHRLRRISITRFLFFILYLIYILLL
jgi:hypothetical protein